MEELQALWGIVNFVPHTILTNWPIECLTVWVTTADTCYDPRIAALLNNARSLFEALGMAPFAAAALSLTRPHPR